MIIMETMILCPLCSEPQKHRGLQFHLRNNHPQEFQEIGYRKLKEQAKEAPKEPPETALAEPQGITPQGSPEPSPTFAPPKTAEDTKAMDAWFTRTGQKIYFSPTPISAAVINQFAKASNPSDVINKALHEYATNRGIQPAIIKTEGGEALSMLGGNNEDRDFNNILKIMAAQNQMNQSSNTQYSPVTQMVQAMRERVNTGMNMGSFGKELMQMIMMSKMMEGLNG